MTVEVIAVMTDDDDEEDKDEDEEKEEEEEDHDQDLDEIMSSAMGCYYGSDTDGDDNA